MTDSVSDFRTFGEVDLAFSNELKLAWTTYGGHCDNPGSFFNAVSGGEPAFYPLGSYGMKGEVDPGKPDSSKIAAMMIRPSSQANPDRPPLAPPTAFSEIWNDSSSGSDWDGFCYWPVAPAGYTALGAYFRAGHQDPPRPNDLTVMACVRNDLVEEVPPGENFWDDSGSKHDGDLGTWLASTQPEPEEAQMCVTAGTFIPSPDFGVPPGPLAAWGPNYALKLPVRSASKPIDPPIPALTSRTLPPTNPAPQIDHEVEVPFTGIIDPKKSVRWQIENSPFYVLKRETAYTCIDFFNNATEEVATGQWQITSGVSEQETDQFSTKVGVTIGAKTGVDIFGNKVEISASVTTEFGWTESTASTEMESKTTTYVYKIPPEHACALWKLTYLFRLSRADGSNVPGKLEFVTSSSYSTLEQYPPSKPGSDARAVVKEGKSGEEVTHVERSEA